MSSSSLQRARDRLWLAISLVVACGFQLLQPAQAAGSQLDIAAAVASVNDDVVRLVAEVRPTATRPVAPDFSVTSAGARLPALASPVVSERPAIGLIVDGSATGATTLQAGMSGAVSFLLSMPPASHIVVVADADPPAIVVPPDVGTSEAVRALAADRVSAGGPNDTSGALSLAVSKLPVAPGAYRVLVLYTSAVDAGGATAETLARRLEDARAVLSVVTTRADTRYWSRVAAATGGVVVAAPRAATMTAFDDVAAALRARYVLTFPTPDQLPAKISVEVAAAGESVRADAIVPAAGEGTEASNSAPSVADGDNGGGRGLLALVVGVVVLALAATVIVAMRVRSARSREWADWPDTSDPNWTHADLNYLLRGATQPETASPSEPSPSPAPHRTERIFDVSGAGPREIAVRQEPINPTGDPDVVSDSDRDGAPSAPELPERPLTTDEPRETAVREERINSNSDADVVSDSAGPAARPAAEPPADAQPAGIRPGANVGNSSDRPGIAAGRAASAAAAVAAAQQRARAVAAATRAAKGAASQSRLKLRGQGRQTKERRDEG